MPSLESIFKKLLALIILLLFTLSLVMNTSSYISGDISWLMEASRRLLAGGTYSHNFMETNPPLILFLYMIPVLLTGYWGSLTSNFLLFTYAIMALSLYFSYLLLNKIITKNTLIRLFFFSGIIFCELILPLYEFGQREHLTVILIIPYLLLVSTFNKHQFPWYFRVSVGVMAGLGFAIKPYFLIPLFLILIWQCYKNRRISASFNLENNCLLGVMVSYLIVCFIVTPDYFSFILPIVFKFYLPWKESYSQLINNGYSRMFYLITLLGMVQIRQQSPPYGNLFQVLIVSNVGFFIVFLMGGHFFYYHFLPVMIFSSLILVLDIQLIVMTCITKNTLLYREYFHALFAIFCVCLLFDLVVALDKWSLKDETERSTEYQLIQAFKAINRGPFVIFSNFIGEHSSLLTYSQLYSSTRLHQLWLLPGIVQLEQNGDHALAAEGKNLVRHIIVEDFLRDPPYLILVDETPSHNFFHGLSLNYFDFLLQDPLFKKIWINYKEEKIIISNCCQYTIYTQHSPLLT